MSQECGCNSDSPCQISGVCGCAQKNKIKPTKDFKRKKMVAKFLRTTNSGNEVLDLKLSK